MRTIQNTPEYAAWQTAMRTLHDGWFVDPIHDGRAGKTLLHRPDRVDPTRGLYVLVIDNAAQSGTYDGAMPAVTDADFHQQWRKTFDRSKSHREVVALVAQRLGVEPDGVRADDVVDPDAVGAEVSWSFGDGDADAVRLRRSDVIEAFGQHGFGCEVEATLDLDEALRRARAVARNRSWLVVRELARPNRDVTRVLGVYVRRSEAGTGAPTGEAGDGWEMVARVRHEAQRGYFIHLPPEGAAGFATDSLAAHGVAEACRLAQFANLAVETAVNGDVSAALVGACQQAGCLSRRPGGGGVYLVLQGPRCNALVRLLRALEAATQQPGGGRHAWRRQFCAQVQEVYAKPLTSRSWAQSAEQQIQATVDRLLGDLEDLLAAGAMRPGTLQKRAQEADELHALAGRCAAFLQDRVPILQERLGRVSAAFSDAGSADLAKARALLADLPDPERTQRAAERAQERAEQLKGRKGGPAKAEQAPAEAPRSLASVLDDLSDLPAVAS